MNDRVDEIDSQKARDAFYGLNVAPSYDPFGWVKSIPQEAWNFAEDEDGDSRRQEVLQHIADCVENVHTAKARAAVDIETAPQRLDEAKYKAEKDAVVQIQESKHEAEVKTAKINADARAEVAKAESEARVAEAEGAQSAVEEKASLLRTIIRWCGIVAAVAIIEVQKPGTIGSVFQNLVVLIQTPFK